MKKWQVMPKISEGFVKKFPKYSRAVLQLLYNCGLKEKEEVKEFLNPEYEKLPDPFLFKDMERAVELIIKHVKNENKITVYGDYDADGVTASALLYEVLEILKARVDIYIPDRVSEGYGLNNEAIDKIAQNGVSLIITVDGGIRNKDEVKYAKSKGINIIITDHHVPGETKKDLPNCLIINPLVKDDKYPYKNLAGVGVAFKLTKAIISKAKLDDEVKQKLEERLLDLVAIGTVADCVSLLGENRALVRKGLEVLNNTKRIGLQELIKAAQIDNKKLDAWNIGFQIGPRLNAAGRMEHANTAFELLTTKDSNKAATLARRLNNRNIERQKTTDEVKQEIESTITKAVDKKIFKDKIIIGVCPNEKGWNEGVIGLVAGRICDKYYLPTLVITKTEDGYKGSGRSVGEFNMIKAIEACKELLTRYGGHPMACGFSVNEDRLGKFREKITEIANRKLKDISLQPKLVISHEVRLDEINDKLISEIEKFVPFGQDNPRPKFLSRNILIRDIINMGLNGQHVKFRLDNSIWAVAFGKSEEWKDLKIGDSIDAVYYAGENQFNGRSEIQLKVVDIKLHNADDIM